MASGDLDGVGEAGRVLAGSGAEGIAAAPFPAEPEQYPWLEVKIFFRPERGRRDCREISLVK